jgi:hypothetical protein
MQYKSLFRNGAILLVASMLTLAACKRKDTTTNTTPALTSADDNGGYASDGAKMESNSNDVISIADVAAAGSGSNLRTTGTTLGGCAMITNDTAHHVLTINFGTTDCTCVDGKKRRGEIVVNYSGHYKDSGSTHTITYSNYYVNDIQLTGYKTVTNEGTNIHGQVWYNVTVSDTLTYGVDSFTTWNGSRTRTWQAGYATTDRTDDIYQIGGVTTLKRANGHTFTFTMSTTNPLVVAYTCPWIQSGSVTITGSGFTDSRILDYGAVGASCDDMATLTIGTHTYNITLK